MHIYLFLFELLSALTVDPEPMLTEALGPPTECVSTIFGTKGDKWAGGGALYLGRPVDPQRDIGIAHRTLPVGSLVVLQNPLKPDKWVVATVVDRGPYGALLAPDEEPAESQTCRTRRDGKVWCVKKKRERPGKWRGCVDTTPKAAKLLEHNGFQRIRLWPIPNTAPESVWDWPAYEEQGKRRRERIEARKRSS